MTRSLYEMWRHRRWQSEGLRETPEAGLPSERLLQAIWRHQRLRRDQLRLMDGRPVRVLHPGFVNREAGPDFRRAVLEFGREPACVGDVEVDLQTELWRAHRHHENPAFGQVILHVVWTEPAQPLPGLPTLAMLPYVDSTPAELTTWLTSPEALQAAPGAVGHCSEVLAAQPVEEARDLLRQAAYARLQVKAQQIEARARQAGWEQALWEGLFRALGYKHNTWAMQRLAELVPDMTAHGESRERLAWEARLLGIAGFLNGEPGGEAPESASYQVRLWDHWWRERQRWAEAILPRALWRLSGVRPANHPERRLALASAWLARGDLPPQLERTLAAGTEDLPARLLDLLRPASDAFWDWHWLLSSRPLSQPQPLVGPSRVTDLAVNVILPWLWIRARACGNSAFQHRAETAYFQWPAAEDNAVLRLARHRLFPAGPKGLLRTASDQQGLLQIVRDWCDHFDASCRLCPWPDLLRGGV